MSQHTYLNSVGQLIFVKFWPSSCLRFHCIHSKPCNVENLSHKARLTMEIHLSRALAQSLNRWMESLSWLQLKGQFAWSAKPLWILSYAMCAIPRATSLMKYLILSGTAHLHSIFQNGSVKLWEPAKRKWTLRTCKKKVICRTNKKTSIKRWLPKVSILSSLLTGSVCTHN